MSDDTGPDHTGPDGAELDDHAPDDHAGTTLQPTSQVTLHAGAKPPVLGWRRRALAVRSALPQIAANPVVLGASAAAVTIAARLALEAARRVVATPSANRPVALTITAHVVHHVHVIHHVVVDPTSGRGPQLPPSGR